MYYFHDLKIYIGNLTWSATFRKNECKESDFNNSVLIFDGQI